MIQKPSETQWDRRGWQERKTGRENRKGREHSTQKSQIKLKRDFNKATKETSRRKETLKMCWGTSKPHQSATGDSPCLRVRTSNHCGHSKLFFPKGHFINGKHKFNVFECFWLKCQYVSITSPSGLSCILSFRQLKTRNFCKWMLASISESFRFYTEKRQMLSPVNSLYPK